MHSFVPSRLSLPIPETPHNEGFSLIEVLISILVLSFGIFGAMKMQLLSMQMSQQTNFYSTAIELASDVAERMRRNPHQANTKQSPFLNIHFQAADGIPESTDLCHSTTCSPDQSANADIVEWMQNIATALPNARAVICRDSSPWNSSTGSLTWDCSGDEHASVVIKLGWTEQHKTTATESTEANPAPRFAIAVTPFLN